MSYLGPRPEQSTTAEVSALTALNNLGNSGTGEFIRKTSSTSFENAVPADVSTGSPAGSDKQIQFNSGGAFGASSALTVNTSTGAIDAGVWNGTAISPFYGGTGISNNVSSTLTISGAFATTFTVSAATSVTLPTTGTLATLAGTEEFTNKTLNASVGKGTWTASGTWTLPAITLGGTVSGGANNLNNIVIGAVTPLAGTFTTITANTGLVPDADDGAYIGQAGTAFSDLFLAEGGIINWDSGDLTLTQTGNELALAGGVLVVPTNGLTINATNVTSTGTQLNYLNAATGTTGTTTTNVVFSTSPTLVTPTLGVASATSLATSAASPLLLTNGQLVTVAVTSQTVGGTTLTIPNFASVSDTFAFITLAQTLSNKTFVAPVLGAATATTINKVTITEPTTSATLTLVTGSSLITVGANAITFTSTGTTGVTLPTTGTLATLAGTEELDNKTLDTSVGKGTWTASGTWTLPAITLGGAVTFGENTELLLDAALSADGKYCGVTEGGTAGATLAFGDLIYLDPTDSRWELCDANAASGADGDSRGKIGICVLAAAADASATTVLLYGKVRADTAFPALTINGPVYVSETAGDVTVTQPTTTDVVIRVVGFGNTADELFFCPSSDYITHT